MTEKIALYGGKPVREKPLVFGEPLISEDEIAEVVDTLRSGWLSTGPKVFRFEEQFSKYIGSKYSIAVNSCTAAMILGLEELGVSSGDEVITTPITFAATVNVIIHRGATPIFVDVEPDTLNINSELIEEKITKRTKAILPVHAFGQPANMGAIMAIAKKHSLIVIEDACEALGAEWRGQKAGTFGDASVFAYYPNKQMTTGEGGMIVTNRDDWRDLFRSLRNQGRDVFDSWLNHSRLGFNYRIDEMSAALGVAQMERIDQLLRKRDSVASCYSLRLRSVDGISTPYISPETTRMSWFVYVVRVDPKYDRNKVMELLKDRGVPTRPYFSPIHLQKFYCERFGYEGGEFPITEQVAEETMALPFHTNLSGDEVEYVCRQLEEVLPQCRR
ncbi:MAG: DegT/DnrJ/EryC1/StrS family aminotransferase [Chloroflexi bacterium]|nr:DegT/DnrJ/EryC1/StrS family aminotransferase [Chloroflexota bacterium]